MPIHVLVNPMSSARDDSPSTTRAPAALARACRRRVRGHDDRGHRRGAPGGADRRGRAHRLRPGLEPERPAAPACAGHRARPAGPGAAARPPDHPALRRRGQPGGPAGACSTARPTTVTSKSPYISGTGAADLRGGTVGRHGRRGAISSSVTWQNIGNRPPVVVHSLVTPPVGGALVVSATTPASPGATGSTGVVGLAGHDGHADRAHRPPFRRPPTAPAARSSAGSRRAATRLSLVPPDRVRRRQREHDDRRPDPDRDRDPDELLTAPAPDDGPAGHDHRHLHEHLHGRDRRAPARPGDRVDRSTGPSDQFSIQDGGSPDAARPVFGTDSTADDQHVRQHGQLGRDGLPDRATPLNGNYTVEAGSCGEPARAGRRAGVGRP